MNTQSIQKLKKAALCTAIALGASTSAHATLYNVTGTFRMYDVAGGQTGVDDSTITGTFDDTDPNSLTITTQQKFFGFIWDAHDIQITQTAGTITVEACPTPADGSVVPEPGNPGSFIPCTPPLSASMDIKDGQWGAQMLFDWNTAANIDVLNVWDVTVNADGSIRLTSTDFDNDGILGSGMADGAFQGFNANFDLLLTPPFPINITATQDGGSLTILDPSASAGNVTLNATVTDAISYDWSQSDAEIISAAIGGTSNENLIIDQTNAGLVAGQTYNISVTVTKSTTSGSATSSTNTTVRIAPFSLSATDTDGDGTNDDQEGFSDTDGDRIPEYLDTTSVATELPINPGDNSLGNAVSSEGLLALGNISYQHAIDTLSATTNNFGAIISVATIGKNDKNTYASICTGGCTDITIKNVTSPSVQTVIPLSSPIPNHPLVRVFTSSGWNGFIIDNNNKLSSAPATSTSPTTCPTPGSSVYSSGLTPGYRCIQLTIEDGGPNDSDGVTNGSISILNGVAELIIAKPFTKGVGGGWWLVLGLPVLLGVRRFSS